MLISAFYGYAFLNYSEEVSVCCIFGQCILKACVGRVNPRGLRVSSGLCVRGQSGRELNLVRGQERD